MDVVPVGHHVILSLGTDGAMVSSLLHASQARELLEADGFDVLPGDVVRFPIVAGRKDAHSGVPVRDVLTADSMTEGQMQALIRDYFENN